MIFSIIASRILQIYYENIIKIIPDDKFDIFGFQNNSKKTFKGTLAEILKIWLK